MCAIVHACIHAFSVPALLSSIYRLLSNSITILQTLVDHENLSHMHNSNFCFWCVVTYKSIIQREDSYHLFAYCLTNAILVQLGCWNPHATHAKRTRNLAHAQMAFKFSWTTNLRTYVHSPEYVYMLWCVHVT